MHCIDICYLHDFSSKTSFLFRFAMDEVMVDIVCFGIRRSFLIIFLFVLNI